jgi:hypothetical protein
MYRYTFALTIIRNIVLQYHAVLRYSVFLKLMLRNYCFCVNYIKNC